MREPADAEAMVLIEGLAKSFGKTQALSGLDLRIAPGTVCAMLGQRRGQDHGGADTRHARQARRRAGPGRGL